MAENKNFSEDELGEVAGGYAASNSDGFATIEQYRTRGIKLIINPRGPNSYIDLNNHNRRISMTEARKLYSERGKRRPPRYR
ncbi:MAG: hypothetical protein LBF33_01255 [Oscillospiraceae bacterium]|jgi:hypothetical protein|nr:hypothetical protein [Oscillospiraceae bacterium]